MQEIEQVENLNEDDDRLELVVSNFKSNGEVTLSFTKLIVPLSSYMQPYNLEGFNSSLPMNLTALNLMK